MVAAVTNIEVNRFKSPILDQTIGSNIFIGDIIKLKQGEISPCDLLVLGSTETLNGSFVCRVDSLYDDGKTLRQIKESITLTKSFGHWIEQDQTVKSFLKHLDAKIEYMRQKGDHSIKGSFKLKADPRVEQFDDVNIVKKGSLLRSIHIYGLVLFNGRKCLDSNTKQTVFITKSSRTEEKMKTFTSVLITINLVFAILLSNIYYRTLQYGETRSKILDTNSYFVKFISLLFSCLPLSINILMNLFHLISAIILQKEYSGFSSLAQYKKLTGGNKGQADNDFTIRSSLTFQDKSPDTEIKKNSFKILNPNVIPDMGDIDEAFFDKTGTLTTVNYDINTISLHNKFYQCSDAGFRFDSSNMIGGRNWFT